jgi:hypothetical protein
MSCELFDGHEVEIREPNKSVDDALNAIEAKYAPKQPSPYMEKT